MGQITKKTGTTDTIPHRTSRCHFHGTIKEIQEIEEIVLNKWAVAIVKDNKDERLFGCENVVRRKELSVILVSKVYAFPLWIMYDSRNGKATMEIRDKDIWHLCGASNDMLERLGKLERKVD